MPDERRRRDNQHTYPKREKTDKDPKKSVDHMKTSGNF